MSDIAAVLRDATQRLAGASDTPRLDAEILMAHALGVERQTLLLDPARFVVPDSFAALVARRLAQEPVAYIIGWREFWSLRLEVGPGVLIPRPDSETLIEAAVAHFGALSPQRILDLGTGPGTLLLAALSEFPEATGLGVDASDTALSYARTNANALGLANRAVFQSGDWCDELSDRFDLVLCNPPYIADAEALMADVAEHEPGMALFAGEDGLSDYRRILPNLSRLLSENGIAILEIGVTQCFAVTKMATDAGFSVRCLQDLGGRDRALLLSVRG